MCNRNRGGVGGLEKWSNINKHNKQYFMLQYWDYHDEGQVVIYREYGTAKKAYRAMEIFNIYCTGVEKIC